MPFDVLHNYKNCYVSIHKFITKKLRRNVFISLIVLLLIQGISLPKSLAQSNTTLTVLDTSLGVTTQYIGTVEGNINFNLADLQDLGINTYRLYGGMSRWETQDDDGVYGYPTIDQIKANSDVINWTWWDAVMTTPPNGSDYWWSGRADEIWQGNAQSLFRQLQEANIRPVLTIRTTSGNLTGDWSPDWAMQLNPPRTQADWSEWWEHVFATVYWLNVRNDYQVNDFEIHNEPDNRPLGWGGNQNDYFELVRVASDAIAYVYNTYLPDRQFHIHAPKTVGGSHWPAAALAAIPSYFDSVNVHDYDLDISNYIRQVHSWMRNTIHERSPLWLGEWGTYTNGYDDLGFSLNLIKNMIRMSQPGDTHVYGSHLFSLYDWGHSNGFEGLIGEGGNRRLSYYAFRMGIRALQGGRSLLQIVNNNADLMAIATQDEQSNISLLVVNSSPVNYVVNADFPISLTQSKATIWQFGEMVLDEIVEEVDVEPRSVTFQMPAYTSKLVFVSSKNEKG